MPPINTCTCRDVLLGMAVDVDESCNIPSRKAGWLAGRHHASFFFLFANLQDGATMVEGQDQPKGSHKNRFQCNCFHRVATSATSLWMNLLHALQRPTLNTSQIPPIKTCTCRDVLLGMAVDVDELID